ncbi:hypothetical protein [Myxosarcina sp. GI1]|uniref:hypothetical protein n=1 Tax=Myxosarcina sp. GI1 TaxID=1541065 RepID=UPI001C10000D|nr:hypothetical protein [Myxosarcina sp. GI1]
MSINLFVHPITNLLQNIIQETHAENKRRHEKKMAEINLIANSKLRDDYVRQLLLDKFLAPVDKAQSQIQSAAKHAQYMAESINYYYKDHQLTKEESRAVCEQFRFLAARIAQIDSLYDLKSLYHATTLFAHRMSEFKHSDRKYSIERAVRKHILDKLGDCIATEKNFQNRLSLINQTTIYSNYALNCDAFSKQLEDKKLACD